MLWLLAHVEPHPSLRRAGAEILRWACECIQVVVDYVAKTPNGKVFDNSLAKGAPYYIRVGSGAVIPVILSAHLNTVPHMLGRSYIFRLC